MRQCSKAAFLYKESKKKKHDFMNNNRKNSTSSRNRNYSIEIEDTACSRNNMGQKCEGNCGLWVLNEMIKKKCILEI